MTATTLILIAHGSKDPRWTEPFRQLAADLEKELGENKVFLCFMENAEPGLMEVGRQIVETGARTCRLVPLFMARGNHFNGDIPAQMAQLREAYPELETELLPPIGAHPLFFELMRNVIKTLAV